jgi:hypothetical protein
MFKIREQLSEIAFMIFILQRGKKCLNEHENRFNNQNYWVFGPLPASSILQTTEHDVSETGSVSFLR